MRIARTGALGVAVLLLSAALVGGCYNFSSYQTAIPLQRGQVSVGGGIGYPYMKSVEIETAGGTETLDMPTITLPYNDYWVRIGVANNVGIGFKWTNPTGIGVDVKIRLLKAGIFHLAIDPELSFHSLLFLHRVDAALPILFTADFSRNFKLYGGLKVFYSRWMCSDGISEDCSDAMSEANSVAFGGFVGISLEFWKMYIRPEIHYYRMEFPGLSGAVNVVQPGIGIGFRFGGARRLPPRRYHHQPPPGHYPPPNHQPPPGGEPPPTSAPPPATAPPATTPPDDSPPPPPPAP